MDTIFMNNENSETSEPYAVILKLTDKLDRRRGKKSIALSNISIYYSRNNRKSSYNNKNLKYQLQHGTINLNYQMDYILSIF